MTRFTSPSAKASGARNLRAEQRRAIAAGSPTILGSSQLMAWSAISPRLAKGVGEHGRIGWEAQIGVERDQEAKPGRRSVDGSDDEFRNGREIRVRHAEFGERAATRQIDCSLGAAIDRTADADRLQPAHVRT